MAHQCAYCGSECFCWSDVSDSVDSLTPDICTGCGCQDDNNGFDDDEEHDAWLCSCGNYEDSGLHCSMCGAEPPWGCPCSACQEGPDDDDDYLYDPY